MFFYRRSWYNSLIGPHVDPKTLPKSEAAYLPLDGDRKPGARISDKSREKYEKAMKAYKQQVEQNKKKNGG